MKMPIYVTNLMILFNNSFINCINELILIPKTNLYLSLDDVESESDLKCKVIEYCSRDAYKTMPYSSPHSNKAYQNNVRRHINNYLGTCFTREDMELIYTYLGNGVNHDLTIKFVESNYDTNILKGGN